MLWRGGNNNVLRAKCDLLRPGNHGLLRTGTNDGLLRCSNDDFYAAPTTTYYAHQRRPITRTTTVYYQQPLVGAGITRVGYAPVTYVTPRATYYAPVTYTTAYSPWW